MTCSQPPQRKLLLAISIWVLCLGVKACDVDAFVTLEWRQRGVHSCGGAYFGVMGCGVAEDRLGHVGFSIQCGGYGPDRLAVWLA